nr:Gamma-glutamyl phosphate reductase [Candidatus Pantoea persica]
MITGGIGVCHIYLDETMAIAPALEVIVNAKKQRPRACNSLETLLIHRGIAQQFIPAFTARIAQEQITLHADENV